MLVGDICDEDLDGDSVINSDDNCPYVSNSDQADADGNNLSDILKPAFDL